MPAIPGVGGFSWSGRAASVGAAADSASAQEGEVNSVTKAGRKFWVRLTSYR